MNEPSQTAKRAAEAICDTFTVLARTSGGQTSFDEAEPIDLAAIIERETGVGEAVKLITYLASQHQPDEMEEPEDADYQGAYEHFVNEARAFLDRQ